MGTSVATELLARDLRGELDLDLTGVLLFDGSIIIERASLTPGQKLLRSPLGPALSQVSSAAFFRQQLGSVFGRDHPMSAEEGEDQWALMKFKRGNRLAHKLIGYTFERVRHAERWHGAVRDWPGYLAFTWGLQDPVATTNVLDGLRELRPKAPVHELPDLAHYPQIEDPKTFHAALTEALSAR
jgi:pimeloyl-ACP methyl ester carboxylesterase